MSSTTALLGRKIRFHGGMTPKNFIGSRCRCDVTDISSIVP